MRHGIEKRELAGSEAADKARKQEIAIIEGLVAGGEHAGVIGIEAGPTLKRLPSNIYWLGLGEWGIRLYPGSQDEYHRSLGRYYRSVYP